MCGIRKIPVTYDGFEIGQGIVDESGVVLIKLNDSGVGLEIQESLRATTTTHLSINPRKGNRYARVQDACCQD